MKLRQLAQLQTSTVSCINPKHRFTTVTSLGHGSTQECPTNPGQCCEKGTLLLAQREEEAELLWEIPAVAEPTTNTTLGTLPSRVSGSHPQLFTARVRDHQLEWWYFAVLFSPRGKSQSQLHHSFTSVLTLLHLDFGGCSTLGRVSHNTGQAAGSHRWETDT